MNTRIIEAIAENFVELTVLRGEKHDFMEMDIEFLGNGRVSLFTKDYIEEFIASSVEVLDANVSLPSKKGLQT